jgi:hypothetical protein
MVFVRRGLPVDAQLRHASGAICESCASSTSKTASFLSFLGQSLLAIELTICWHVCIAVHNGDIASNDNVMILYVTPTASRRMLARNIALATTKSWNTGRFFAE